MPVDPSEFNDITRRILAGAIEVHRTLGPGLLQSIYAPCLHAELTARQLKFVTQRAIPIVYRSKRGTASISSSRISSSSN